MGRNGSPIYTSLNRGVLQIDLTTIPWSCVGSRERPRPAEKSVKMMVRNARSRARQRNIWAQVGVSAAVLLLPPIALGAAVYAMLPAREEGPVPAAARTVVDSQRVAQLPSDRDLACRGRSPAVRDSATSGCRASATRGDGRQAGAGDPVLLAGERPAGCGRQGSRKRRWNQGRSDQGGRQRRRKGYGARAQPRPGPCHRRGAAFSYAISTGHRSGQRTNGFDNGFDQRLAGACRRRRGAGARAAALPGAGRTRADRAIADHRGGAGGSAPQACALLLPQASRAAKRRTRRGTKRDPRGTLECPIGAGIFAEKLVAR